MTLNGQNAHWCRKDASFGAYCTNLNENMPVFSATKMYPNDFSFWKYEAGASNESGVVDDCNFWRFQWLLLRTLQI